MNLPDSRSPLVSYHFERRFGMYRVDFETQARVAKLSASFFRDVVARNAIGV